MLNAKNDPVIDFDKAFKTLSEKISVLQARDKFIRIHKEKQTDIDKAEAIHGCCLDMCPEYERYCREDRNLISPLEMTNGLPDEYKMVKEYVRSGADQEEPLPHELRPPSVLEQTMLYLCTNIMNIIETESNVSTDWFDFLWSRTRAIRKDITQQHLCGLVSVKLMEICARFHIYCAHRLCEEDLSVFDPKINNENLTKCIQSLKDFYFDLSLKNIQCKNEAEFRCYDILLNLHNGDVLRDVAQLKPSIRDSLPVKFAIQVYLAYNNKNFVRFFIYLKNANFLNACIMHRYFTPIRLQALHLLKKAFVKSSQKEYFLKNHLIEQLLFDNEQSLVDFCQELELPIEDDYVVIIRSDTSLPSGYKEKRSLVYIENKKNGKNIGEIVYGELLNEGLLKKNDLTCSFDKNGFFIDENIRNQMQKFKNDLKSNQFFGKNETQNKSTSSTRSQNVFFNSTVNSNVTDDKNKLVFGNNSSVIQKPAFNVFQKSFENAINHNNQIDSNNQDLFGKKKSFRNLFATSKQNQNVFGYTDPPKSFFNNETQNNSNQMKWSTNDGSGANSFHFKLPEKNESSEKRVEESSENLILSKSNDKTLPITSEKEIINNNDISSLAANIYQKILDELVLKIIKKSYLQIVASNQSIEIINEIFNEVVSNLTQQSCKTVYNHEIQKHQQNMRLIGLTSKYVCDKLIDECLDHLIRNALIPIYKEKLNFLITHQSKITVDVVLNETLKDIVQKICFNTYTNKLEKQRKIVKLIKEKRSRRLAKDYFNYWKFRCEYLKRFRYIKATFPASKLENSLPSFKKMKFDSFFKNEKRKLDNLSNDDEKGELNTFKILNQDYKLVQLQYPSNDLFLEKINKKLKQVTSTKSKLEYAKQSLSNLCKISETFNSSLAIVKPYLMKNKK